MTPLISHQREANPAAPATSQADVAIEESIPDRLATIVRRFAQRTAIETARYQWDYETLDHLSDAIAQAIDERCPASSPVALCFAHDAPVIAAMLGVLKANRAYVVLSANDPPSRRAARLSAAGCEAVIHDDTCAAAARSLSTSAQTIAFEAAIRASASSRVRAIDPDSIAAIMFTSGSTGEPRCVPQTHRNLIHQAHRYQRAASLSHDDRLSLLTPCDYAASVSAIYGALLHGGTVLPFDLTSQGLERLAKWLSAQRIRIYHSVPTVFRALCRVLRNDAPLSTLRLVRLGGETVHPSDLTKFRNGPFDDACRLMVSYSSTETGLVMYGLYGRDGGFNDGAVTLDRIAEGVAIAVMNSEGRPAAIGECGELCVTSGYLSPSCADSIDTSELSAHPRGGSSTTGLYRTGDLARHLGERGVELLGRSDRRIKVRGVRINLDEVEAALLGCGGVGEAAVVAVRSRSGARRLVGFVAPAGEGASTTIDWRSELARVLPPAMIPAPVLTRRQLPHTATGKVDRAPLQRDYEARAERSDTASEPRAELERKLARIWERALDVRPVGMDESFDELGADSLGAASVLEQIDRAFGVRWTPGVLLEAPTIARLAERLSRELYGSPERRTPIVRIQLGDGGTPLVFVHALDGGLFWLRPLAALLPGAYPVIGLQSPASWGHLRPVRSVSRLAHVYAKELRDTLVSDHCIICGYCMGGAIALELARASVDMGMDVRRIVLIDTPLIAGSERGLRGIARGVRARWRLVRQGWRLGRRWRSDVSSEVVHSQAYRLYMQALHRRALETYTPKRPAAPVTVLKAEQVRMRDGRDTRARFIEVLGANTEVIAIPGDHLSCLRPPHLHSLVQVLSRTVSGSTTVAMAIDEVLHVG